MVQVKLTSRKDKVLLKMSFAMDIPWSRNTVKIIGLFLNCIMQGMTKGCGRSTAYIYWIEMGQDLPPCSCLNESAEHV